MTQFLKKNLLKTIRLLKKANDALNTAGRKQQEKVIDILIQCQEAALEIGESLEAQEICSETIVPLLEDYCETLYQISQSLNNETSYRRQIKKAGRQLSIIEDKIRYDIPDEKKEIVFFPYKASMWDSLESIWKAAAQDESCEAYVVPIPYFEKNTDGTLGEIQDEGCLYPPDVPIVSWKEYSVEKRQPDIIYIHNPYDQCNCVTSVHPDFYASRLKQYTGLLVYVPYFVSTDHKIDEHFCTLPGILYADRVIVEDEEIRKFHMNTIQKYENEHNCRGAFGNIEKKFLALGSPKFDKILSNRQQDIQIPPRWQTFLHKQDGTRKRVIFYNSTIDALLNQEQWLEKIKSVLKVFYENRKNITLLWRPHPLSMITLQTMRSNLAEEYEQIVKEYKKAGYGIYDDTPDLHRAIALSDAYYGDWSSVVSLYQKTGKPILIQSYE